MYEVGLFNADLAVFELQIAEAKYQLRMNRYNFLNHPLGFNGGNLNLGFAGAAAEYAVVRHRDHQGHRVVQLAAAFSLVEVICHDKAVSPPVNRYLRVSEG